MKVIEQKEKQSIKIGDGVIFDGVKIYQPMRGTIFIEEENRTELAKAIDPAYQKLEERNADLVEALKRLKNESSDLYDHCIDKGYLNNEDLTEGQEMLLSAFELANEALNQTT